MRVVRHTPNILTALRLAAAPVTAFLLWNGDFPASLGVFAFAGLTDVADGYFAKTFRMTTRFGAYLDPAADKFLMLASFLALSAVGATPLWLTVLVIARDAMIVGAIGLACYLGLPLSVRPQLLGKISTVMQVGYVAFVLALLATRVELPLLTYAAAVATAVFTLASGLFYAQMWFRAYVIRHRRPA